MSAAVLPDTVIAGLLEQVGGGTYVVADWEQGGNNQVYRIRVGDREFALKKYLLAPSDNRSRLESEWSFLVTLSDTELASFVPRPYAVDRIQGVALYEFVRGRKLVPGEISESRIEEACTFIHHLNDPGIRNRAVSLGPASDARFSISAHADAVEARLRRFYEPVANDEDFIRLLEDLRDCWGEARRRLEDGVADSGLDWDTPLASEERIVSPSDFGFHNAVLGPDGRLVFIDFEYAGWDDPAKLSADFFFQPALPVPGRYYATFLEACLGHLPTDIRDLHCRRARMLRPLFGLIWCCIILNPFTPEWVRRHASRIPETDMHRLRRQRLHTAAGTLAAVKLLLESSSTRPGAP